MCCKSRDQPHTLPVSPTCFDIGNFGSAAAPEGPTCPGGPCKRPAAAPGTGPKALLGLVRGKSFASPPSLSVLELFPWVIPLGFFFSTCGSSVTTNGCVSRSPAEQFGVKRLGMGQLLLQQCCREVWPELRGTLLARSPPLSRPVFLVFGGWISLSSSQEAAGLLPRRFVRRLAACLLFS